MSLRSSLRRLAAALLLAVVATASGVVLAGCGSEPQKGDEVDRLLDRAFRQPIKHGQVKIDAQLTLEGLPGFQRPVRLQAVGPYVGGGARGVPTLDMDVTLGAQGAGQTVQFGLLRTGDRAFVKFGGEFYEQPRVEVRRANRELGGFAGRRKSTLRDLGLHPRSWARSARQEDAGQIAGVEAHHVSGALDTRTLFRDLSRLLARSGGAIGDPSARVRKPLSRREIDELATVVGAPRFDVYVGKRDEVIRRLSATLELRVPKKERIRLGGLEGGALRFSIEFSDLDGRQRIEAPAKARPIAELATQLGGLSTLGALGGGSDADPGKAPAPARPRGLGGEQSPGGKAKRGVEALRRYSDCLDKANPDDSRALSLCTKLLR